MATITRHWDTSSATEGELFKKFLRQIFDTTERKAITFGQDVYRMVSTEDEWEKDRQIAGLGLAEEMAEGQNIPIQAPQFGGSKTYTQRQFGTGFRVTMRMKKFNKWKLVEKWTRSVARSQKEAKDKELFRLYNGPTAVAATSGVGFDGLDLAEAAHTGLADGTGDNYDNLLSSALSVAAVEDMEYYFDTLIDDLGQFIHASMDTLVFHPRLKFTAKEIYKSDGRAHEFSNTANVAEPVKFVMPGTRLTSTTAWFALAKNDDRFDINCLTAMEPDLDVKNADDNTRDTVVTSVQFFDYGFGDPRLYFCGNT
jgi:hypothetical protein